VFCPDCGTWNRGAAVICVRCAHELPELPDAPQEKPDEEMDLVRRATGGRYRIYRRLATGGMASVYAARHALLGRPLVIKVLLAHLARDPEMRERLVRAIQALPEEQRAVVALRFWDDMSVEATAEALGMKANTVKSDTARALAKLKGLLDSSIHETV